ncbi:hypothetical protein IU427_27950 [Nocardia beijingensis]|uniref:hypothetical protein n=1 Tax=Nocardia beijingensis TaxID=95162 RepID=UPI0018935BE7|nr:hypothetical protein [Nocardia beijingensis]MBF6468971.1 hypothetical protein [Nocardia beijingensis]
MTGGSPLRAHVRISEQLVERPAVLLDEPTAQRRERRSAPGSPRSPVASQARVDT